MTENQNLRQALQAIANIDDATNHSVDASAALDRIGQIARQALALPTEPAHADTWGISRAMVTLYAYECDGLTGDALALPTADHIPDAGEMVNGLTKAETDASASVSGLTAAPVGEREAFEREMSKPPFEFCMGRWPDDGSSYAWPGNYAAYHTQCAWDAWQARAALSAQAVPNPWRDAVIEQLESWHIYVPAIHENSPRLAIKALVNIETQTALDPKVSSQAAALAAGAVPDERDKVDAQRYRWLRDESWAGYNQGKGFPHVFTVDGAGNRRTMLAEEALDAAIDAAMRKGQL